MTVHWFSKLDWQGREILRMLGFEEGLPGDHNPIVEALRRDRDDFVASLDLRLDRDHTMTAVSKAATLCQMAVFDRRGGPEGDGKPKGLRRHWYQWYKTEFAQPYSEALGQDPNDPRWGLNWAGRLSETYAYFVDQEGVTYRDLWVEDASRMIEKMDQKLFRGSNILFAIEKDSLMGDFAVAARALGATALYSGKGKSSKAAIEKVLRESFGWNEENRRWDWDLEDYVPIFSHENPLVVIHVSDYDYDGEAVIGPTFGDQATRYTSHVIEVRVGIDPADLQAKGFSLIDRRYQVKLSNNAYVEWADEKAMLEFDCDACGTRFLSRGNRGTACVSCGTEVEPLVLTKRSRAYGYEVEAMPVRAYHSLAVDALLAAIPFDYIVERLRDDAKGDPYEATERVRQAIAGENASFVRLEAELERLSEIRDAFLSEIGEQVEPIAIAHRGDFADEGDDPATGDFVRHVEEARDWSEAWRPFDYRNRTNLLVEFLLEDEDGELDEFKTREIEF